MDVADLKTVLRNQIAAQEMPAYVYTYPPKSAYQPFLGPWQRAAESWRGYRGKLALYVHVPFCEMKCTFCDLFTVTNAHEPALVDRYVRCILAELDLMRPYLADDVTVGSLYFGGGTPTLLAKHHLQAIVGKVRDTFRIDAAVEVSIEGAPNTLSAERFADYLELGFNRLSIGIQTFDDAELAHMGRHYGAELGAAVARAAVDSGIANVNIDLIYGIPDQTRTDWQANLERALAIGPQTVTAYPLVIRDRTTLGKRARDDVMHADNRYDWYDFTVDTLSAGGYRPKTLVTYARDGGGCLHEENEYMGMPTLALGAGARKYGPIMHYVDDDYANRRPNLATTMAYMDAIERGAIPIRSAVALARHEQQRRFVILGLLSTGIRLARYAERFDEDVAVEFAAYLDALESEALLVRDDAVVALTAKGKKYSSIIGHLLASKLVAETKDRYR
jgi:oxygen-independent coproporphyrinogen III oxidase